MGPRYQVVMGSTLDPVPDLISLSQAGSRFDFELPPKASEMQPSLSSHALKQLLKLAKVLERLFFGDSGGKLALLSTSVEHPEAPPCDLDGLEDVATLLSF